MYTLFDVVLTSQTFIRSNPKDLAQVHVLLNQIPSIVRM